MLRSPPVPQKHTKQLTFKRAASSAASVAVREKASTYVDATGRIADAVAGKQRLTDLLKGAPEDANA